MNLDPRAGDTSWANALIRMQTGPQLIYVLEPVQVDTTSSHLRPFVCLLDTIQFFDLHFRAEIYRGHFAPRSEQFVVHEGRHFEATGGRCVHVFGRWHMEWACYANTERARHLNGVCDEYCRPCRIAGAAKTAPLLTGVTA